MLVKPCDTVKEQEKFISYVYEHHQDLDLLCTGSSVVESSAGVSEPCGYGIQLAKELRDSAQWLVGEKDASHQATRPPASQYSREEKPYHARAMFKPAVAGLFCSARTS